jgi:hypothetical protein
MTGILAPLRSEGVGKMAPASMSRLLKLDPRPAAYDSLVESLLEPDPTTVVASDVEVASWSPIPAPNAPPLVPAFVDGVQRMELRVSAEGGGWPVPGILASCAAGAICPDREQALCHVAVERRVVLARGARPVAISLRADNAQLDFIPESCAGRDFESLSRALNDARARLESEVVRQLLSERCALVVVDGRLPQVRKGPVVGLIKTLHDLYVSEPDQIDCLGRLRTGQRSPIFLISRRRATYYSWFVCLRTPGPFALGFSGLVRLEMDESLGQEAVLRTADATAALLPGYASTPERDDRAPQNLLPVGQLERELRHRLGDPELIKRWAFSAFQKESLGWTP